MAVVQSICCCILLQPVLMHMHRSADPHDISLQFEPLASTGVHFGGSMALIPARSIAEQDLAFNSDVPF